MNEIIGLNNIETAFENIVEPLIDIFLLKKDDPVSIINNTINTIKMTGTFRDMWFYKKIERFLEAIKNGDNENSIELSSKLFCDEKTARKNVLRLIHYIDEAETLTIVDYIVNATRSAANGLIKEQDYFRILWTLTNTFSDDLHYFKEIAVVDETIEGNTQIIALAQVGLMISAGIDANRSIEKQDYAVTDFGIMVDRYALSLDDEERLKYWRNHEDSNSGV